MSEAASDSDALGRLHVLLVLDGVLPGQFSDAGRLELNAKQITIVLITPKSFRCHAASVTAALPRNLL